MPDTTAATIIASLRERLAAIDVELATLADPQDERARVVAAIEALDAPTATQTPRPRTSSRKVRTGRPAAKRGETTAAVLGYLEKHPGSSAGAIADALGLKRNSTSTRLTQMAKAGAIIRSEGRGYELPRDGHDSADDISGA